MPQQTIAFLIPGLSVGGAERHTIDLRARLEARGILSSLIVHGRRRSPAILSHPGAAQAIILGLKGMSDFRGWLRVRREFKRQNPKIIVAINQMPLIVSVLTRFMHGTRAKIICIFHTTVLRDEEHPLFFLFRWTIRWADALVFVSENQKSYWVDRGLKCRGMPVILNGVDLDNFSETSAERKQKREQLGFSDNDIVFGLVASFRPEKSHQSLISALALLRERGTAAKVLFVGDGPTRSDIERMVETLGLRSSVVFAGEQADVGPFISSTDVGVLCSVTVETFSLSALEFLAMGKPMVMSDIGGASEIVSDGQNGFLFAGGDIEQLAHSMERMIDPTTRQRLSLAARPSMNRLAIESMVNAYSALFHELEVKESGSHQFSNGSNFNEKSQSHLND